MMLAADHDPSVPAAKRSRMQTPASASALDLDDARTLGINKTYFENFRDGVWLIPDHPVAHLGGNSKNGLILDLPFLRDGHRAHAVLKCARDEYTDNLLYEYLVGVHAINGWASRFPCFVETYDAYLFRKHSAWSKTIIESTQGRLLTTALMRRLQRIEGADNPDAALEDIIDLSCHKHPRFAVMIQHFTRVETLRTTFAHLTGCSFELLTSLYQVYFVLDVLGNKYTHYDLHGNNVLLHRPFANPKHCVWMRYHRNGQEVAAFPTRYVAKIIDYGRNYVSAPGFDSNVAMQMVCLATHCEPGCGEDDGYYIIRGSAYSHVIQDYVDATCANASHDVRCAVPYARMLGAVTGKYLQITDNAYGRPEDKTEVPGKINNVHQLRAVLEDALQGTFVNKLPAHKQPRARDLFDNTWRMAATLDVYDDGAPFRFALLPEPQPLPQSRSRSRSRRHRR